MVELGSTGCYRKKKERQARDMNRNKQAIAGYKDASMFAKETVAKIKKTADKELYKDLEGKDSTIKTIRMTRQRDKNSSDNCQVKH